MIAYLQGELTYKSPTNVYLDIGGIAYDVNISLNTFSKIESETKVKLYTHLHVKEDSHTLYGFFQEVEKYIFKMLISISGIGPNTARITLSYMNVNEVRSAIMNENVAAFKKVKGVGPKTAKLIILELKNKIAKIELEEGPELLIHDSSLRTEAIAALTALGFQKAGIEKQIDKIMSTRPELTQVEVLIKEILRQMS